MFSYQFYKVVHIVGIVLAVSALGGAAAQAMLGGSPRPGASSRRLLAGLHGLGAGRKLEQRRGVVAKPPWLIRPELPS